MEDPTKSDFEKQIDSESICEICHTEMTIIHKEGKRFKYDKNHTMYECSICGFKHRKRTQNEILRDIGERDDLGME
jgi:RNase P subunit RPR2